MSARRALVPLIAALALLLSSCGGDTDSDQTSATSRQNLTAGLSGQKQEAAAAIEAYVEAFDAGDPDQICPLTSRTEAALERCKDTLPEFDPVHKQPQFELRRIVIHGSRADATIVPRTGSGRPVQFQLQRVGGEWKIVVASLQS